MCVEWQLPLDIERREQEHARAALSGEPAREVEGVPRVLGFEQRNEDHSLQADQAIPRAAEPAAPAIERPPREVTPPGCHPINVGRCCSAPPQDQAAPPQHFLTPPPPSFT